MNSPPLEPVGFIRSTVKGRADAPRQGSEGAPDAWLEIEPRFANGLLGIDVGHELIVITWLDKADRSVLQNHPRGDESRPLTGTTEPARLTFRDRAGDRRHPPEDWSDRSIRRHSRRRH